jgi:hypothetical protein
MNEAAVRMHDATPHSHQHTKIGAACQITRASHVCVCRQKYLKPLNPNAKKLTKADLEEHMARVQRLFQV